MMKSLVPCSGQLELGYSNKFISRCSSMSAPPCSLLSVTAKTLVDRRRQRKIPAWEFRCVLHGSSFLPRVFGSVEAFIFWYLVLLITLLSNCIITLFVYLVWSSKQQTEGCIRSSRRIIHISCFLFLSFCLIKRLNSLMHLCCKLSAHKIVTTAHYRSRYSCSTLWKYVIYFIEYVYRIWVLWYKWMYLTCCLNLLQIMRSTGMTNGEQVHTYAV